MPIYAYKAKKISGEELNEKKEARNPEELARSLRNKGFILISYSESGEKKNFLALPQFRGVSIVEKINFAKNLSVMIASGVSLVKGFEILSVETQNKKFQKMLLSMADDIRKGESLSKTMENHPDVFSALFRAMVRAGEISGKLDSSLNLIAEELKQEYELTKKIKGALIYPAIIFGAMIVVGVLMLIYVVPTLAATFKELNIPLPLTTRFFIGASSFLVNDLALFLIVFVLFAAFFWYYFVKSGIGRKNAAYILLKLPVISSLVIETNTARTARTLGSLTGSGVQILEALEITENVLQNHYYKAAIREAKEEIQKGKPISQIFIKHDDIYPRVMGEMTAVGEETGKLSEMLFRIAEFYEGEVASKTKDLSTIVEPVLMLLIGAAVGFFAVSMIQPMYSMVGAL
jgi:type IV pilus assembly protein PilC